MEGKKKWLLIGGAVALVAVIAVVLILVLSSRNGNLTLGLKKGMTREQVTAELDRQGLKKINTGSSESVTYYSGARVYGSEATVLSVKADDREDWIGLMYRFATKEGTADWMDEAARAQVKTYASAKELAEAFDNVRKAMEKELGEPTDSATGDDMVIMGWEKDGNVYLLDRAGEDSFVILVEVGIDKLENISR